ncbi:MAG: hypothetical protein K2J20_06845, partial [Bacilli bacterium]|nr:hypothetical protein [Bacilli bacterium]
MKIKNLKLVFLYKSFLFTGVQFETDNKELESIVKALNIKDKTKRLEFIYDSACSMLDAQFQGANVCGFKNNQCYTQHCTKLTNGCCRKCIYQSSKGCTTSNLTCKLFYCGEVTKRYKVLTVKNLTILKCLSKRQQIILQHDYFSSREEFLADLKINSLI